MNQDAMFVRIAVLAGADNGGFTPYPKFLTIENEWQDGIVVTIC